MPEIDVQRRIEQLRNKMSKKNVEAAVIFSPENRIYFSQFFGSSGALVITQDATLLFTDSRYSAQAAQQAEAYEVITHSGVLVNAVGSYLKAKGLAQLGIEGELTVSQFNLLKEEVTDGKFEVIDEEIMELRKIKDEYEIARINKGIQLCSLAFEHILNFIRPGISEKEIGLELEYVMKKNGADQIKSSHVIASGERSALPHGQATERIVKKGDFVKMDIGSIVDGYYSDFTRTVVVGEPSDKQLEVYDVVYEALEKTLEHIKPGLPVSELDRVARSYIAEKGYGENFLHSIGHSLGLNIHEQPVMRGNNPTVLEPGMVITVEPGIYLPGWGGVRIEDLVVIREDGFENLTTATKELQKVGIDAPADA